MNLGYNLSKFLHSPSTSLTPNRSEEFCYIEESWLNKMLKKYPKIMSFWKDNKIGYKFNNRGFRSDFNFYPNKSLKVDIYLGCSITLGQEHIWENTWPYLVSKHTGNTIINLGIPGTGIERGFFDLSRFIDYYDVQNVFHFQPFYPRYSYMSRDPDNCKVGEYKFYDTSILAQEENICLLPWDKSYMYEVMSSDEYLSYTYLKNIYAIQGLCQKKKVPYFFLTNQKGVYTKDCVLMYNKKKDSYYWMDEIEDSSRVPARDLVHPPSTFMKMLSKQFIELKTQHPSGFIPEFEDIDTENIF